MIRHVVRARSNQTTTQTDISMSSTGHHPAANAAVVDRLVKAKSDGSISSSSLATTTTDPASAVINNDRSTGEKGSGGATSSGGGSKLKSRSLEPLTSLAMWCEEVIQIELVKGDRGLGFSILDYQDPMNKEETVVVIRRYGH